VNRLASPDAEKRAQALLEQGATLYEQGKLYEALSCWKQVLQIDPQNEIAAEYLRFIEDNFQIGVDAFMEHHDREPESMPARSLESQASIGGDAGESYEELDWSEILDEGPDRNLKKVAAAPVPVDLGSDHGDDDFFAELKEPSPVPATARASEVAWGANDEMNDSGVMMSMPVPSPEPALQPEADPLSLPASRFAAPFRAPASTDLPSSPSESMGNASRRRRTSVVETVPATRRRTSGLPVGGEDGPAASTERRGSRDMSDMADESIQRVLDDEFKAFDDSGSGSSDSRRDASPARGRRPAGADDVDDLEALLSRGLGELPSGSGSTRPAGTTNRTHRAQAGTSGPRSNPPSSPSPRPSTAPPAARAPQSPPRGQTPGMGATGRTTGPAPAARDGNGLESLIRAGLADLERGSPTRPAPASSARKPASEPPPRAPAAVPAGGPAPGGVTFSAPPPGADLDDLMLQARRKQSLGDFSGSLQLVEQVLSANADHVEARRYLTENTARLLEMYRSKLGKIVHRPRLKLRQQEIIWQSLDHRAGFLLSQVDGGTSYEDIIEISGLSELEATRLLAKLVDQGVIG
jgi:hypothetical protein